VVGLANRRTKRDFFAALMASAPGSINRAAVMDHQDKALFLTKSSEGGCMIPLEDKCQANFQMLSILAVT
jgi:hypothetical protein